MCFEQTLIKIAILQTYGHHLIIIHFDFAGAYPSIEHPVMLHCLKTLNTAEDVRCAIEALYTASTAYVDINGEQSDTAKISKGFLQGTSTGCPIYSATHSILARNLEHINEPIRIEHFIISLNQHFADDIMSIVIKSCLTEPTINALIDWCEHTTIHLQ